MYKPRLRNIAGQLEDGAYMFVPPSRSIFTGAEVFTPWDDDDDSDSSSSSDSQTDEGREKSDELAVSNQQGD